MYNEFINILNTADTIAYNRDIEYISRREQVKQLVKKAENIYRRIYKDLSFGERREARFPINELKKYFRF